ncbi:unnamed protein product [Effrenium voratum]|uniref:Uncharacterized protein n=1 Tax=Effrenium voratum TaxID=2562239 RepID=A0AA36MQS2_9DINO|nr:unnamed protein product [Effrenium voratum]
MPKDSRQDIHAMLQSSFGDSLERDRWVKLLCCLGGSSTHPAASALLEEFGESEISVKHFLDLLYGPEAVQDDAPEAVSAEYGYEEPKHLASFLNAADIRLVRVAFLKKLHRLGQAMPRRQEAERAYVELRSHVTTALVTPEELTAWAEAEQNCHRIISVSHAWESQEHPDPHNYQLGLLAEHLKETDWVFYDYLSLYQSSCDEDQERSFRAGMKHMHLLYSHEGTSTVRIEGLTPKECQKKDLDTVQVYSRKLGRVAPVRIKDLVLNDVPYASRGWCVTEREWSATRSTSRASARLSRAGLAPEEHNQAPTPPVLFRDRVSKSVGNKLHFTRRGDVDPVLKLQATVYRDKARSHKNLSMSHLDRTQFGIFLDALKDYSQLERLQLKHCEIEAAALCKAIEASPITAVQLEGIDTSQAVEVVKGLMHEKMRLISVDACGLRGAEVANLVQELMGLEGRQLPQLNLNGFDMEELDLVEAVRSVKDLTGASELDHKSALIQVCDTWLGLPAELQEKIGATATKAILQAHFLGNLKLDLEEKVLGDAGVQGLTEGLRGLSQLQQLTLNLWNNNIGDASARGLAEGLRGLAQLQQLTLGLSHTGLGDAGVQGLTEGLRGLSQLQQLTLNLWNNNIGDASARGLAEGLRGLAQLQQLTLGLSHTGLGAAGAQGLAKGLCFLVQLQQLTLNLFDNKIGDAGVQGLTEGLRGLSQLQQLTLNLWNNNIGDAGAHILAEGLRGLVQLRQLTLHLPFNEIGVASAQTLAEGLQGLTQLQQLTLDLRNNGLGDAGVQGLTEGLRGLAQLHQLTLNLRNNRLGDAGAQTLAEGLRGLAQLQLVLNLRNNRLGERAKEEVLALLNSLPKKEIEI